MATDNATGWYETEYTHACQKLAQVRAELAQAHIELRQIRKFWLNPAGAAQIRAELIDACAARDALARECNELEEAREYNAGLVKERDRTIAHVRQELKDLQGANRAYGQQLADVTENREFWYKEAQDAEAEVKQLQTDLKLNARMLANQCDQAREAENKTADLRRQLKDLQGANRVLKQQLAVKTDDGKFWYKEAQDAEIGRDKWREDWESATAELLNAQADLKLNTKMLADQCNQAREAENEATVLRRQLAGMKAGRDFWRREYERNVKRLATLDTAEAALANCGLTGIYKQFSGPANAIEQMVERLVQLEGEQALQVERAKRQSAETSAHILSKSLDELAQTLSTERQLRREAERERDDINKNLKRMVELNEWSRNELDRMGERAERAEALAQLVNEETATLLERLARHIDIWGRHGVDNVVDEAYALAAEIREALDDSQA